MSAVRCRVGDVVRSGRAISVAADVDPRELARAVRREADADGWVAVVAAEPGPVHEYVGCIHPGMGLETRTALAAAARSRGVGTPHDDRLAAAREELATLDVGGGEDRRRPLREAAAQASEETDRLREAVATARGRLRARREQGLDPTPAAEDLADVVERLSEAETAAAAARQRLDTVRGRTRERRDAREERFRVEERVANLERRARAHLREQVREEYYGAVDAVPGGDAGEPFGADPVTRALAVARVGELSAPVVLACDRFERAEAAADWLEAPVIRV